MVRRVVTGHDSENRAVVVADDQVEGTPLGEKGGVAWVVWGRDDAAEFPDDGAQPDVTAMFPPVGGCRMLVMQLAPGGSRDFDEFLTAAMAELADPERPGVHRTASLDFDIVVAGDVVLELDDGHEVELHAGDVVVQNGTSHRWVNRSPADVTIAVAIVGAHHALVAAP